MPREPDSDPEIHPPSDDPPAELVDGQFTCEEGSESLGLFSELRRLSSNELSNTLHDLFGESVMSDVERTFDAFPADGSVGGAAGFQNVYTYDRVKPSVDLASDIASAVVDSDVERGRLFGSCASETPITLRCARDFVLDFAPRVLRRPLESAEVDTYAGLFELAGGGPDGLKSVLMGLLISPSFLYHVETGDEAVESGQIRLTAFEVASRIAYRTTESAPDDILVQAAQAGELETADQVRAHVLRLLDTERGQRRLLDFFSYWFEVRQRPGLESASEAVRAGLDDSGLTEEANDELFEFLDFTVLRSGGTFEDLMTSKNIFAESDRLADLYGAPVWGGDDASLAQTTEPRSGVMGRAVMLASGHDESDPILRGVFLRTRILCDTLNPPDPVALSERNEQVVLDPALHSKRERVAEFTRPTECMACHQFINELAFPLEQFDGLGRYREQETVYDDAGNVLAVHAIDSAATPEIESGDDDRTVRSLQEMAEIVAESSKATACMTRHWFRFSQYREETVADSCQLRNMHRSVSDGSTLLDAFVLSIAQPRIFFRSQESN